MTPDEARKLAEKFNAERDADTLNKVYEHILCSAAKGRYRISCSDVSSTIAIENIYAIVKCLEKQGYNIIRNIDDIVISWEAPTDLSKED